MNFLKSSFFAGALIFLITGCSDEAPWDVKLNSGKGSIKLDLTSSADVTSAIPRVRAEEEFKISSPSANEFQIKLSKSDGSYSKLWASVKDFAEEHEFPVGTYDLEAFYGNVDSQGIAKNNADYKNSYYYAKQSGIKVTEGGETPVSLHAVLANSMIIVEYSDEFKNYFANGWSTTLQSQGKPIIDMSDEENMTYIIPGTVEVIISATHQNGNNLTLNPGNLQIEPQHVYKIRYNVYNGELGQVDKLEVIFNDDTEEHIITVDLTEELLKSVAPVVTTNGFENGEEIVSLSGSKYDGNLIFNVMASGEIAEARLTISSSSYNPSYLTNGVIDLCQANDEQQEQLMNDGIKAIGFYNNPDKMAQIDFSGLCKNLPEGLHEISLIVKDKNSKTNEPVSVKISSQPVEMKVEPLPAKFGQDYAELKISYNGSDPTQPGVNPFSFKVRGIMNYEPCSIISINNNPYETRSFESKEYIYKIQLPEIDRDILPVRIYFNEGKNPCMETEIAFEFEDYTLEYDAMATKVRLRFANMENEPISKINTLLGRLRVFVGDKEREIKRDFTNGYVVLEGLESEQTYSIKTSLEKKENPDNFTSPLEIKTDKIYEVPNGNFEDLELFLDQTINQGDRYRSSSLGQYKYNTERYNIKYPTGWATVNSKTCNIEASNPDNTWFVVASTYNTSGTSEGVTGIAIRNVGYNYNGTLPGEYTGSLLSGGASYNPNFPDKGNIAIGKLFLGSYSIDISNNIIISERYQQGVEFKGRPNAFKGYYKYDPFEEDLGLVEISLWNGETILASGSKNLSSSSDWNEFKIELDENAYSQFGLKATSLRIMFASSNKASEFWEEENNAISVQTITGKTQKFLGSELIISNLEFEY